MTGTFVVLALIGSAIVLLRRPGPVTCPACTVRSLTATRGTYRLRCTHCGAAFVRIGVTLQRTDVAGGEHDAVPEARVVLRDTDEE